MDALRFLAQRAPATSSSKLSSRRGNGMDFTSLDTWSCPNTFICRSHLLMSEPERAKLSVALQMLKQNVARRLRSPEGGLLWQPRYYDFNVWSESKRIEKLRYIHRNPVERGLVKSPEHWPWSSFRHYISGVEGIVEIESHWTARKREQMGVIPHLVQPDEKPHPVSPKSGETRAGHPQE